MTALDTDILSLVLVGHPGYNAWLLAVARADRCVPVVAAAGAVRGRRSAVRAAEAGRGQLSLARAYELLDASVRGLFDYRTLHYTPGADAEYQKLKAAKVRVGTNDLRIASICLAHGAKLVTRNARDYAQVPGLNLEVWA